MLQFDTGRELVPNFKLKTTVMWLRHFCYNKLYKRYHFCNVQFCLDAVLILGHRFISYM